MNNNLVRKEKIDLIKGLLSGKQLSQLLPKMEVSLIENEPGKYIAWVDHGRMRSIPVSEADQFIKKLEAENKGKTIEVCVINHAEFLVLEAKFEAEY